MEPSPSTNLTAQPGKDGHSSAVAAPPASSGTATAGAPPPQGAQAGNSPAEQTAKPADGNAEPAKPAKPWVKPVMITVGLAVLVVGALWGLRAWEFRSTHASTDDAYVTADIVQITPQVAGSIVVLPVRENQHVRKGDLLARLDDATFQADLEQ